MKFIKKLYIIESIALGFQDILRFAIWKNHFLNSNQVLIRPILSVFKEYIKPFPKTICMVIPGAWQFINSHSLKIF